MSDTMTPLATITALPPLGMVTIRGALADAAFADAVHTVTGIAVPDTRRITPQDDRALGWMSPDELLLICPHAEAPELTTALTQAFGTQFAMAVEVSDARAVFDIDGPHAREVLAKLAPVDLAPGVFEPGELRRTRLAQVAAAFWMTGPQGFRLIAFRSVAQYVEDLLTTAAKPGTQVGLF
jgi:sarcosine oxidase subunit gamma